MGFVHHVHSFVAERADRAPVFNLARDTAIITRPKLPSRERDR
jgi:hypothetical protein